MRLTILCLCLYIFIACTNKDDRDRLPCTIHCGSPQFRVAIDSLAIDSTNIRVRRYEKNGRFNVLIDDIDTSLTYTYLSPLYDYEIYLEVPGSIFRISNISFIKRDEPGINNGRGCMGTCFNELDTMIVSFNGQLHAYKFERINQYEHILFL